MPDPTKVATKFSSPLTFATASSELAREIRGALPVLKTEEIR